MRKITFTIPGIPGLTITATEQADGSILFELLLDGGTNADIRGLFFDINDPSLIDNLQVIGADVTNDYFGGVSNLGRGNNMKGKGGGDYDAGMSFGGAGDDDITSTSFVLSSIDGEPLTLDLIANVRFGARLTAIGDHNGSAKMTFVAPAAPDAIDDNVNAVEDTPISFDVIANDTDADGDPLTIVSATDPAHGTVAIIGNQIFYTPDLNFGGDFDTFDYSIDDNNGGSDTATVRVFVEAVADAPTLTVATSAGASVNEIILTITSALTDTDGSESLEIQIDTDMLPPGATLSRTTISNPGAVEVVLLTLPPGTSADFDLVVRAISTEASNNDMAETNQTLDIDFQVNANDSTIGFQAVDQSMWSSGAAFSFTNDTFLGIDTGSSGGFGSPLSGSWSFDIKAGLQSHFELNGGLIDATVPFDVSFDTFFNVTTDVLVIDTSASLVAGGSFLTDGPNAEYLLDFVFDFSYDVELGIDVLVFDITLFDVGASFDNTLNLIDYDSETDDPFEFALGNAGTLSIAFPELDVAGLEGLLGMYSGDGASTNFLDLSVDIDQVLANIFLGGVNPFGFTFSTPDVLGVGGSAFLDIIDLDLNGGLNFLQDFALAAGSLTGTMIFEDGTMQAFSMSDTFEFADASDMDTDGNGIIEFDVVLDQVGAMLNNETDIGFTVGFEFDILEAGYEFHTLISSTSDSIGPLFHADGSVGLLAINVFDATFELDFETEDVSFFA